MTLLNVAYMYTYHIIAYKYIVGSVLNHILIEMLDGLRVGEILKVGTEVFKY